MVISEQRFISEIIAEQLPNINYCILSGPSFAEEMVQNMPTLVTLASKDLNVAEFV